MTAKKEFQYVSCPHCGRQYLPEELFTRDSFLGKPNRVIRDALGKILFVDWKEDQEPVFREKYICDGCERLFIVSAEISYNSSEEDEELDFTNQFTSLLDD